VADLDRASAENGYKHSKTIFKILKNRRLVSCTRIFFAGAARPPASNFFTQKRLQLRKG
jgi:hypothetical protein